MKLRPDIWLVGVPLAAGLAGLGAWLAAPDVETRLRGELQAIESRGAASALAGAAARVEIEGRQLTVTSDAALAGEEHAEAARLASAIPGLRGPLFRVLPPASVAPFSFGARRAAGGLLLDGFVPPGGARIDLVRRAGAGVRDDLRTAHGAPAGFGAVAEVAVDLARLLDGGKVALTGTELDVSGIAETAAAYRRSMELVRTLPAGYAAGRVEIVPPLVSPFSWSASRESDRVRLGGNVPSESHREVLLTALRIAAPGADVADEMDTARGLDPGIDFEATIRQLLPILSRVQTGRVELQGRTLSVTGRLPARDLLASLERDVRSARLPGLELGAIDLKPVPASPYRFAARRAEGRIVLTGFLPDEGARSAVREQVRRRFPIDAVADDLHLADGAPDGLAPIVARGLDRLSALAEGQVSVEGRRVRLQGRGLYPEETARIGREFSSDAQPGWTVHAEVGSAVSEKPLDPDFCADLIGDEIRRQPIGFEAGKPDVTAAGRKALVAVSDVIRRCGSARVAAVAETGGGGGDPDAARLLAEARANAVAAVLAETGVRVEARARPSPGSAKTAGAVTFEVRP